MKQKILDRFEAEKRAKAPLRLDFKTPDGANCALEMVTESVLNEADSVKLLAKWRDENSHAFPAQFKVTIEGTKTWCQKAVVENPERVLFWVLDSDGKKVGHVGLFRLSDDGGQIEIDNIMRGEVPKASKLIRSSIQRLLSWQREELGIAQSYLRVFSDNAPAIRLYEGIGYQEIQRAPLKSVRTADRVDWKEIISSPYERAEKYFVTMHQTQPERK